MEQEIGQVFFFNISFRLLPKGHLASYFFLFRPSATAFSLVAQADEKVAKLKSKPNIRGLD